MGTLREYETLYALNPELTDDAVDDLRGRLKGILDKMGASLLREETWGKKKFSFVVQKHLRGNFVNLHYVGPAGTVEELERTMRNLESVIRFLTTKHGEVVDIEARKIEVEKAARDREAAKAKREAEREAEMRRREEEGDDEEDDDERPRGRHRGRDRDREFDRDGDDSDRD